MKQSLVDAYWIAFCQKENRSLQARHTAFRFGKTKEQADELAALVLEGVKTATTSAYELYEKDEKVPQVGEYAIVLNGSDEPVCIIQIKAVTILPYDRITPGHAWQEGEGDRSYRHWRAVHDVFFEEEYRLVGKTFDKKAPMVCEVFEKVYE